MQSYPTGYNETADGETANDELEMPLLGPFAAIGGSVYHLQFDSAAEGRAKTEPRQRLQLQSKDDFGDVEAAKLTK
jgi:hypothetical protein